MTESETPKQRRWPALPRPALLAAGGTLLLFVLVAALAFEPFVRVQATRKAALRGLDVRIGEVDLGSGGIWLEAVEVGASTVPALKARLDAVFVPFGSGPIRVHGGNIALTGSLDEVKAQLSRLRKPSSGGGAGPGNDYLIDGIQLSWSRIAPGTGVQRAWGLGFKREAGKESVSVALLRVAAPGAAIELRGGEAEFSRQDAERVLGRARAEALSLDVDVSALLPASAGAERSSAPVAVAASSGSASRLQGALLALAAVTRKVLAENAELEVPEVRARLRASGDVLNFGPSRLGVERKLGALRAVLSPGETVKDTTPLAFKLTLPLSGGEPEIELDGGPVSLGALGVHEGDLGLFDVRKATLEAHTKLTLIAGPALRVAGSGSLRGVSLTRPALAPSPLRALRLGWRGTAEARLDGTRLAVSDAELTIGDVSLKGSATIERSERSLHVQAEGGVPLGACEKLMESVPEGFAPQLAELRMTGTFSAAFAMDVDSTKLAGMKVDLDVKNACVITHVPASLAPTRFRAAWVRTVKGADGEPLTIESGPGSAGWVPYDSIARHVETSVLVSEDGGFFRHDGFDYGAIEKSIQDNVRAGRFVRGASTISMQLAKNLYLGKEKTLSRKFEEAILTRLLEQQFQKQELMELYLNVIEFGPGIYGIGAAARHYFNVEPQQLTLGQSLYLGSILPSPSQQHFGPDGLVSERWTKYLQRLMHIAHKIKRISDEELAAGLEEQVAFRVPGAAPPAFSDESPPDAEPSADGL